MYIGILSVYAVIIFFRSPETKGMTIEEIAVLFDGERAAQVHDIALSKQEEIRHSAAATTHQETA